MYYRFSLTIVVFFLTLSTATPGLADCDPAAIAGKWNIVTRLHENKDEDGVYTLWNDCTVELNRKGNIDSIICSEPVPGDLTPGDPSNLTGVVLGHFKLSKSCQITGQLVEKDEDEIDFIHIRGTASRDVQVMEGAFYAVKDSNSIDIFTGTKN